MMKGSKKLLLIGIDQAIPCLLNKFLDTNILPNIAKLRENGVMTEAFSCPPCDTPTNWTTIATGATTAIHGATSFYMHNSGDSFEEGLKFRSRTQLSRYCKAEYIWNVVDKSSLIPFVFNYPSGWPNNFKKGVMSLFTWEIPESYPILMSTSKTYKFDIEDNKKSIQLNISIKNKNFKCNYNKEVFLINLKGNKFDALKLLISEKLGWQTIREKEWSNWIEAIINTNIGQLPCLFKIKLQEIDYEEKYVKIKRSTVYNIKGWAYPETFGDKLIKNVFEYDLPEKHDVEFMMYEGIKKYLISAREESLTLAKTINFAKTDFNWDVCFFHYHPLDTINHNSLAFLFNKSPFYEEDKAKKTLKNVETAYKIVDELIGNLFKTCVDQNTIVCFVSDHGAIPIWKIVNLPHFFIKSGLLKYKWSSKENCYIIDWKKTKVFPYIEPPFIWINLEGRDPKGIVKHSEYDDLKDEVIKILYDIRDPYTNEKLIDLAIKKEDADYLGLNGERIGDIIYFLKPPYSLFDGNLEMLNASRLSKNLFNKPEVYNSQSFFGAHAYFLPKTKFGEYSISVPLILSGPGIKKGEMLKKPVNLVNLAPTFSHLLQIPKPKDSQARVLYEIME
ncbi:MAG: hypothetical protein EAX89_00930 [Candidatus Lokiarchaeota archaeon]|nr:hypothetical protein [Candidatus Lokiarchaeota archaeon]